MNRWLSGFSGNGELGLVSRNDALFDVCFRLAQLTAFCRGMNRPPAATELTAITASSRVVRRTRC